MGTRELAAIRHSIISHPTNAWAANQDWEPIYTAHPDARIVIIGQAPGRLAQEGKTPWQDPSGDNLRRWMGISDEDFYDETKVALLPMDFYCPNVGSQNPRLQAILSR